MRFTRALTLPSTQFLAVVAPLFSVSNTRPSDPVTRFLIPTTVETIRATIDVTKLRAVVAAEVKEALIKGGWKITNDGTASPSGRSIRVEVSSKSGKLYKVSFTGVDDKESAIILTLP